jgi:tRNA (guanine-N7-)-methyltransferase
MDPERPRKLFGRRKGWKLGPHQQGLMETLLPAITIHPRAGLDPRLYFEVEPSHPQGGGGFDVRDVWLEVGFGGGEHLVWQAEHHPDIGMIGAEPFVAGVARLLGRLSPLGGEAASERSSRAGEGVSNIQIQPAPPPLPDPLPQEGRGKSEADLRHSRARGNLRVYPGDAADVIDALPDASIGRVFVLFPDPWPKRRHHKRRFLQTEMLDRLARVMRKGAELRVATDDAGYLAWALERATAHPSFRWIAQAPADWRARPADWPPTRYEEKALHGRPYYLAFIRL